MLCFVYIACKYSSKNAFLKDCRVIFLTYNCNFYSFSLYLQRQVGWPT